MNRKLLLVLALLMLTATALAACGGFQNIGGQGSQPDPAGPVPPSDADMTATALAPTATIGPPPSTEGILGPAELTATAESLGEEIGPPPEFLTQEAQGGPDVATEIAPPPNVTIDPNVNPTDAALTATAIVLTQAAAPPPGFDDTLTEDDIAATAEALLNITIEPPPGFLDTPAP